MYTKVTHSHIQLLGQTLTGFAIDDDDAVTAAESDDHGAARGGGAETERERENVGESVDVTKRMTMGACVACSESL